MAREEYNQATAQAAATAAKEIAENNHNSELQQVVAVETLGEQRTPESVKALKEIAENGHVSTRVQFAATRALKNV